MILNCIARIWILVTITLAASVQVSQAAAIRIVEDGTLIGANNIAVGDSLFNVRFVDGSCISLFSGCESNETLYWQTRQEAIDASLALFEQVFVGDFPPATNAFIRGCTNPNTCMIFTPTGRLIIPEIPRFNEVQGIGIDIFNPPRTYIYEIPYWYDLSRSNFEVYAIWSATVPEPRTVLLFFLGMLGLVVRRKLKHSA